MRKYRLPPTSDEYLRYTAEELLVEFYEDYLAERPELQVHRDVDERTGQAFFVTGDPLVDKWEREVAAGLEPDLDEALSPSQREHEEAVQRAGEAAAGFEGIEERFD